MSIYVMKGHVYHSRSETAENSFRYPIFNLYFSISEILQLKQHFKNQFYSLLGLVDSDYLKFSSADSISAKIKKTLKENYNYSADQIYLQTIPRMFGYAFNPVNFWYCFSQNKLDAVLCEVNNTFNEAHYYWLYLQGEDLNDQWLQANKEFHVSPFFSVDGYYKFRFRNNSKNLHIDIQYFNSDHSVKLLTWVQGKIEPIDKVSFLSLLVKYGWMTPLVIFRIHYQALKLFFKKVQFYKKPHPPKTETTYGSSFFRR